MIPTRYKAKLSRRLSWPIGAEALTEGVAEAPHAEQLTVSFLGKLYRPDSPNHRILDEQRPCTILAAEFKPARKPGYGGTQYLLERGLYDEKWMLTVYPVLRELRQLANRLLKEQGLPALVRWLWSSQRVGWSMRSNRIELVFSPTKESISVRENSGV
jgi:hypothetical protein